MNIIFGDALNHVPNNYTVLELDTFRLPPDGALRTSYCVVDTVPLTDFPMMEALVKVHTDMMQAYRDQNWDYCEHAIAGLTGKWNGELDSFYNNLYQRVVDFKVNPPTANWTGVIDRTIAQDA